jgi:tetratricopeptide (TPR) repeat protein
MRWTRTTLLLAGACLLMSCATRSVRLTPPCAAAGPILRKAWGELEEGLQTPGGCDPEHAADCEYARVRIERLAIDCPNIPDVILANALLAFDARSFVRSQELLDELFSLNVTYPQAVVLRARIALEQGNTPYALRFLKEQIDRVGDDSSLREAYASALFVARRWDEATGQLTIAEKLGAPAWRIAYSQGLIAEESGKFEAAKVLYQRALAARPGWRPPQSRLRALVATGKVTG